MAAAATVSASSPKKDPPSPTALSASAGAGASPSPSPSPSPSSSPDRSPSPLPLQASLPSPPPTSSAVAASSRRLAAPIWTHEETLALIDAYRDKWYALRRGNLRASHWQEVAEDVAGRCPSGPSPPKTSVQCRHKVEKLRKRYRSERQKSFQLDPSLPPASSWVYFRKMDTMENGGSGGVGGPRRPSAPPSPALPRPPSDNDDDEEEEEEEADDDGRRGPGGGGNTRSLHRLMANGGGAIGELRFTIPKAVRSKVFRADDRLMPSPRMNYNATARIFKGYGGPGPAAEEMRGKVEKKRKKRQRKTEVESGAVSEMVSALRMLGDGFLRMEQRKMEMAREIEKMRMETELKRTELILDSQRRIVDTFLKGFSGKKRAKFSPED